MEQLNRVRRSLGMTGILLLLSAVAQAQTFTVLHNFTGGLDGANPYTGLTMDRAGNLYGTALYGGLQVNDCHITNGCGTVFKLAKQGSGWIFRPLYQFQGFPSGDGANPLGRVIFGPDGALYGTTAYGGLTAEGCGTTQPGCGTVFKLSPPPTPCRSFTCNWEETQIYNFTGTPGDGIQPQGEIEFDAAGNLYGSTYVGGSAGGTVYKLTHVQGSWTQSVLASFLSGWNPYGGVQLDQAGNVYVTTTTNATVFQLVSSGAGWTLNNLHQFTDSYGVYDMLAGVIVGPGGNLYGGTTLELGGPVLYELSPSNGGWDYATLYTFSDYGLSANLVMDSAGNLYGTTFGSGRDRIYGSVFKLTPSNGAWTYTDLHDFTNSSDGAYPYSTIVLDPAGNLYGTASGGGVYGNGVVWEITP